MYKYNIFKFVYTLLNYKYTQKTLNKMKQKVINKIYKFNYDI